MIRLAIGIFCLVTLPVEAAARECTPTDQNGRDCLSLRAVARKRTASEVMVPICYQTDQQGVCTAQGHQSQTVNSSVVTQEVRNICSRPFNVYYRFGAWERMPFTPNISPRYFYGRVAARGALRKTGGWEASAVIADC